MLLHHQLILSPDTKEGVSGPLIRLSLSHRDSLKNHAQVSVRSRDDGSADGEQGGADMLMWVQEKENSARVNLTGHRAPCPCLQVSWRAACA